MKIETPSMPVITTKMMKTKKIVLATDAAPDAIPVNPNTAATIAMTKKMAVHFNIISKF